MLALLTQTTSAAAEVSITPHFGVAGESELVSGQVRFSDGDSAFVSIEPRMLVLVAVEVAVKLGPSLAGVLGLSYAFGDARYFEDDNPRPDASYSILRLQPGVVARLFSATRVAIGAGGGLTLARIATEDVVWDGARLSPSSLAVGLFGTAAVGFTLSARASLHVALQLELSRASVGDIEEDLAAADGETSAAIDSDARTALLFLIGVKLAL